MTAKTLSFRPARLLVGAMLATLGAGPAWGEAYSYKGTESFRTSFYLIGGQYELYVDAHAGAFRPTCSFMGNFQRVWPTHDAMTLGSPVPIYAVPYRLDSTAMLPAGLYSLYIVSRTDCAWRFNILSTAQNGPGIAPVQLFERHGDNFQVVETASMSGPARFYAQFRTNHGATEHASGTGELSHDGTVIRTFPLTVTLDATSGAPVFIADIEWRPDDAKYLGKNAAKFTVKIGPSDFTSTGAFTLAH